MTQPDDKVGQVRAIAEALYRLPPPARAMIAADLYDQGVRLIPQLSTKRVVRDGPAHLGNWAPAHLERGDAMDILQKIDPQMAERIAAARTEDDKAALRAEIKTNFPEQIAEIEARMAEAEVAS